MPAVGYLRTMRRYWFLALLGVLLGVGAAGYVTSRAVPVYEARVQLFVAAVDQGDGIAGAYQGGLFTQQRVKSYADVATTPRITGAVVDRLDLPMTPAELSGRITAEVPLDTVLVNLAVRDADAERARALADAVGMEFSSVVEDLERTSATAAPRVKVTVVRPAEVPTTPVAPRPALNLALGGLLGLLVGAGGLVLRSVLDTTVKSLDELSQVTGHAALGVIGRDQQAKSRPLIVHVDPGSPRAEAFRTLRTNLQFVDVDRPPRVVVVTSPVAGEGKSTTACNLAIVLAQAGTRVAVVEADLRRPKVADYLGVEGAVGLTNILIGRVELDDALQQWGRDGLWVLPSGPIPPNPSELLGSRHMEELLAALQERVDVVIIDAPPLLPVTDAAVLSRVSDGAVIVARYGRTRRDQLTRAVELLRRVDARVLGTILTVAPRSGPDATRYEYAYGSTGNRPVLRADQSRNRRVGVGSGRGSRR